VDAEDCWSAIASVMSSVKTLAVENPDKNSFGAVFYSNGKAEAKLSSFWDVSGYTEDLHKFLFQQTVFGFQMRDILASTGKISFGTEGHSRLRKIIIYMVKFA
jgi:hypothetical protein